MKEFETPELEITLFALEDIIATSVDEGEGGDNDLGIY